MANKDQPRGLEPVGDPIRTNLYYIPSTYETALGVGDPVVRVSGGSNSAVVETNLGVHEAGTLPEIAKASLGDNGIVTGVIVGFATDRDALNVRYSAADTEDVCIVADHPYQEFVIQGDGGGTLGATAIGLNAIMADANNVDTVSGRSGVELDEGSGSAPSADASNPLRIKRLDSREGNALGVNASYVVDISRHTEAKDALGI